MNHMHEAFLPNSYFSSRRCALVELLLWCDIYLEPQFSQELPSLSRSLLRIYDQGSSDISTFRCPSQDERRCFESAALYRQVVLLRICKKGTPGQLKRIDEQIDYLNSTPRKVES